MDYIKHFGIKITKDQLKEYLGLPKTYIHKTFSCSHYEEYLETDNERKNYRYCGECGCENNTFNDHDLCHYIKKFFVYPYVGCHIITFDNSKDYTIDDLKDYIDLMNRFDVNRISWYA
jgi:predicted NodU family carbamoyl transferase